MARDADPFDEFGEYREYGDPFAGLPPLEVVGNVDDGFARDLAEDGPAITEASLADPDLKARLGRLAPRVIVGPALDATVATASRRRWSKRAVIIIGAAAVLLVAMLLLKGGAGDGDTDLASGGGSTTTRASIGTTTSSLASPSSVDDYGSISPDPEEPSYGTFVPGTYLPSFGTLVSSSTVTSSVDSTATTATTAAPARVDLTLTPRGSGVTVGDRLLVDFTIENDSDSTITFERGCAGPLTAVGDVAAHASVPAPYAGGTAFTGQDAQVGANTGAANAFGFPVAVVLDGACESGTGSIDAGQTLSGTLAVDADALPLALTPSFVVSASFSYSGAAGSPATDSASVAWNEVTGRTADMDAIYDAVSSDSQVRAFLDGPEGDPERQIVQSTSFHDGRWVFRFTLAGGGSGSLVARVDPANPSSVSVS